MTEFEKLKNSLYAKVVPNGRTEVFQIRTSPREIQRFDQNGNSFPAYQVEVMDLRDNQIKNWTFGKALFGKIADQLRANMDIFGSDTRKMSKHGVLTVKATQMDSPLTRRYEVSLLDSRKDYGNSEIGKIMRAAFSSEKEVGHICNPVFSNGVSQCQICLRKVI